MSARLTLVVPDLFDHPGGIARISQSLVLAAARWVERSGWRLAVRVLHDGGERRDDRICPTAIDYRGFSGDRRRFAASVVATAGRGPTVYGHVNFAALSLPGLALGGRYAVVAHGVEVWRRLSWSRTLALKSARELWPVSRHTGEVMARVHGLDPARVHVIENALGPFQVASADVAVSEAPRFLTIARLLHADRDKGVDRAIEAFADVFARVPDATFEVIGDGDDRARLEALARALGLGDRVRFLGRVDDATLEQRLLAARALVLPSTVEGFGLVYVEAMARGRAVLAVRAGGTPEVVEDGVTGLLVPAERGDRDAALTEAWLRLATDHALAVRLGDAGRARVAERFRFERYAADIGAALGRLTSR